MSNTTFKGYNVRDFGASGEGKAYDTEAIKKAVRTCHETGGGTVHFPSGRYLTAPFEILSGVSLFLDSGSVIVGSTDINDYFVTHTSMESPRIGLIYARDARDISISGKGAIDCRGMAFMDAGRPKEGHDLERKFTRQGDSYMRFNNGVEDGPVEPFDRPGNLIQFMRCTNITLRDITILDGPNWTVHFDESEDVVVSGITISNNQLIPNSDGVHFTVCRNVRVSDCHITAGDDCIALTNYGRPGKCTENVVVTNCILSSCSAGIRIGYGVNDLSNCMFHNLVIQSNRGIGVFQRNEGNIRDVVFSNIVLHTRLHTGHWWGHGEPVHISTEHNPGAGKIGKISNIRFSDITARSETGIIVYGCPDSILEDIRFDGIKLHIMPSRLSDTYGGNFDLRPTDRPETSLFAHKEYGLYASYARNLNIRDFELAWEGEVAEYFEDGMLCENCEDLSISGYAGRQPHAADKGTALTVRDSRHVSITGCKAAEGTGTFLAHSGITEAGLFTGNDLTRASTPCEPAELPFAVFGNHMHQK